MHANTKIQSTLQSLKRRLDLDKSKDDDRSNKNGDLQLEDLENALKTSRLLLACENGDIDTVKKLFRQHGKMKLEFEDKYGRTALVYAAANGHLMVVRELLRKNANREHCCEGASPLYWAVSRGHANVVQELLIYDANPDSTNEKGWTPLMNASYFGRTAIVRLLLNYGSNVDITRIDDGKTALHWACKNGRKSIVALLLGFGANPNIQDKNKQQTPLMYAILGNYRTIAQLLLSYAADPFIANVKSKSALDLAQDMSSKDDTTNGTKDTKHSKNKKKKNVNQNESDKDETECDLVVLMQQAGRLYTGIQQVVNPRTMRRVIRGYKSLSHEYPHVKQRLRSVSRMYELGTVEKDIVKFCEIGCQKLQRELSRINPEIDISSSMNVSINDLTLFEKNNGFINLFSTQNANDKGIIIFRKKSLKSIDNRGAKPFAAAPIRFDIKAPMSSVTETKEDAITIKYKEKNKEKQREQENERKELEKESGQYENNNIKDTLHENENENENNDENNDSKTEMKENEESSAISVRTVDVFDKYTVLKENDVNRHKIVIASFYKDCQLVSNNIDRLSEAVSHCNNLISQHKTNLLELCEQESNIMKQIEQLKLSLKHCKETQFDISTKKKEQEIARVNLTENIDSYCLEFQEKGRILRLMQSTSHHVCELIEEASTGSTKFRHELESEYNRKKQKFEEKWFLWDMDDVITWICSLDPSGKLYKYRKKLEKLKENHNDTSQARKRRKRLSMQTLGNTDPGVLSSSSDDEYYNIDDNDSSSFDGDDDFVDSIMATGVIGDNGEALIMDSDDNNNDRKGRKKVSSNSSSSLDDDLINSSDNSRNNLDMKDSDDSRTRSGFQSDNSTERLPPDTLDIQSILNYHSVEDESVGDDNDNDNDSQPGNHGVRIKSPRYEANRNRQRSKRNGSNRSRVKRRGNIKQENGNSSVMKSNDSKAKFVDMSQLENSRNENKYDSDTESGIVGSDFDSDIIRDTLMPEGNSLNDSDMLNGDSSSDDSESEISLNSHHSQDRNRNESQNKHDHDNDKQHKHNDNSNNGKSNSNDNNNNDDSDRQKEKRDSDERKFKYGRKRMIEDQSIKEILDQLPIELFDNSDNDTSTNKTDSKDRNDNNNRNGKGNKHHLKNDSFRKKILYNKKIS